MSDTVDHKRLIGLPEVSFITTGAWGEIFGNVLMVAYGYRSSSHFFPSRSPVDLAMMNVVLGFFSKVWLSANLLDYNFTDPVTTTK